MCEKDIIHLVGEFLFDNSEVNRSGVNLGSGYMEEVQLQASQEKAIATPSGGGVALDERQANSH